MEKATNLSSSPINLLQSIAAKALNFKLKNSASTSSGHKFRNTTKQEETNSNVVGASVSAAAHKSQDDTQQLKRTKLAANYNRLLRQYRFFKSTNIESLDDEGDQRPKSKSPSRPRSRKIFKKNKCMEGDEMRSAVAVHEKDNMLAGGMLI